eukprot:CAMPEP_0172445514 /NCGR_PEP_ID=MMETSP1065-20121228/5322_1 /TAXON_ID=265537 /ORGANISM="Amphiprora paludosa, Strain CCMP125" /LENGTH=440 /DNA_ID=CAMNT_0013196383 /DNA_START=98 /DNA_END=1420 /DNA_ORIENTATION=+
MTTPPLSSRLVNVAEDAELRLVSLLGEHSPSLNVPQCEACINSGNATQLLQLILADKGSVASLVTHVPDVEEAIGSFALLVALIAGANDDQDTAATRSAVTGLGNAVVQAGDNAEATCGRKLRLLAILYNLRAPVLDKVEVLRQMMIVAGNFPSSFLRAQDPLGNLLLAEDEADDSGEKTGAAASRLSLTPSAPRIVQLMHSWQIDTEQRFALYQTIVQAFQANPLSGVRKQRFLLLSVECASSNKTAVAAAAKEAAIGAVRDPISLFAHQRNILNIPSISALAQSEPILFGLLKIFQEGKLSDYEAFLQSKGGEGAVLGKWNLDAEGCRRNMRILSLCSLASEHEEIPYQSIAETLQIDVADNKQVEAQVIAAVSSGLLEAKMDQLSKKVLVERCVVRQFDVPQWKTLQQRLQSWKDNVGSILSALEQAETSAATAAAT